MLIRFAVAVAVAALPLAAALCAGCERPDRPRPDRSPVTVQATDFRTLLERDPVTDADIDAFVAFGDTADSGREMRVFTMGESDFTSGRVPDSAGEVAALLEVSADLRRFARAVIDRGNALRDAGDPVAARRHYNAVFVAADANSWQGVAQVGKLTADAMRRAAGAELAKLPAE